MSRYLLDTHVFVWAAGVPERLSRRVTELVRDESNELLVSAATAWEISTKHRLGKLPGAEALLDAWDDALATLRATSIPVRHAVALRAGAYASSHRDPFDRLLAAEAELSGVGFVTADPAFADFPVRVVW